MNPVIFCLLGLWSPFLYLQDDPFIAHRQHEQSGIGPLSQMTEFHVIAYTDSNLDSSVHQMTESLGQIGTIHIASLDLINSFSSPPTLCISVTGDSELVEGSIRLIGEVLVCPGQYKIIAPIWEALCEGGSFPYPVSENGMTRFERRVSPVPANISAVTEALLSQFIAKYREDNPDGLRPIFHIHSLPF